MPSDKNRVSLRHSGFIDTDKGLYARLSISISPRDFFAVLFRFSDGIHMTKSRKRIYIENGSKRLGEIIEYLVAVESAGKRERTRSILKKTECFCIEPRK